MNPDRTGDGDCMNLEADTVFDSSRITWTIKVNAKSA